MEGDKPRPKDYHMKKAGWYSAVRTISLSGSFG